MPQKLQQPEPATARERGILFSADMVRAILDGRKTQTRRIVKLPPMLEPITVRVTWDEKIGWYAYDEEYPDEGHVPLEPKYSVGDRLWVREAHRKDALLGVAYRADESDEFVNSHRWRPSIHMHKAHARIWLEVTDVRVQRVQEIGEEDARAEGCGIILGVKIDADTGRRHFAQLWERINGPGAWSRNDWAWAYTFRRLPA